MFAKGHAPPCIVQSLTQGNKPGNRGNPRRILFENSHTPLGSNPHMFHKPIFSEVGSTGSPPFGSPFWYELCHTVSQLVMFSLLRTILASSDSLLIAYSKIPQRPRMTAPLRGWMMGAYCQPRRDPQAMGLAGKPQLHLNKPITPEFKRQDEKQ